MVRGAAVYEHAVSRPRLLVQGSILGAGRLSALLFDFEATPSLDDPVIWAASFNWARLSADSAGSPL